MLKRFLALFIFGALLMAAAACGGGGGALSLEDYFQELDTIFENRDAGFEDMGEQYPESFSDPDETRDYLDGAILLLEGVIGDALELEAGILEVLNRSVHHGVGLVHHGVDVVRRLRIRYSLTHSV